MKQVEKSHADVTFKHGLINCIDTKAKCRHLKKMTCKGLLRQVAIRVYRLEILSVLLVFSTQFFELLPLSRIQCVRGAEVWGSGPQTYKHLSQSPFTGQFF